jgi:hypothetical protein
MKIARKIANAPKDASRWARKVLGFENFYQDHVRPRFKPAAPVSHFKSAGLRTVSPGEAWSDPARSDFILTPKKFLGSAGRRLDPEMEKKLKRHLDDAFAAPEQSPPGSADLKAAEADSHQPRKVLMAFQQHINGDPAQIDSDFYFHFTRSAKAFGLEVKSFNCDHCAYKIRDPDLAQNHLEQLRNLILQESPDIVVFDGNYIGSPDAINPEWWAKTKSECGFKLVTVIGDSFVTSTDYLGHWGDVSDLSVIFNRQSSHRKNFPHPTRLLCAPSLPYADEVLDWELMENKDIDFCFIGSNIRNRTEFCSKVKETELVTHINIHTRFRTEASSIKDYFKTFCRSKTVFNTGFTCYFEGEKVWMVTGRAVETILCKALLLEEDGAALSDYFLPWRHFIPVTDAHEVAIYAQFFAKNEEYRRRIVESAFAMHRSHYSSAAFWRAVLSRLYFA